MTGIEWVWFTWLVLVPTGLTLWNVWTVGVIRKQRNLYMLYSSLSVKSLIWYAVVFLVHYPIVKSLVILGYIMWSLVIQGRIKNPDAELERLEQDLKEDRKVKKDEFEETLIDDIELMGSELDEKRKSSKRSR